MSELISIIVPVYNVKKYLKKCINSIIQQTYTNLEIILIDDGSTDECGMICDEYDQIDERVKVIHKLNGGLSAARNTGIDAATGAYIAFVDSDDYIAPDTIEKLYQCILKDNTDMAVCNIEFVNERYEPMHINTINICNCIVDEKQFWHELYGLNHTYCVVAWNKLYRKKLFENIRYDYGKCNEDEFIIHKLVEQCNKISFMSEKLYFYLQREGSIMNDGFSLKRLDAAEAFINRSCYFCDKGWQKLAELALIRSIGVIMKGQGFLNRKDMVGEQRIKELYLQYKKAYRKIAKQKNASLRFRLNGGTFYISPNVYRVTHTKPMH